MSAATSVSVAEFIRARDLVAARIKASTTSSKVLEVAESLMGAGYIDIDEVLKPSREREKADAEAKAKADLEAKARAPKPAPKPEPF